MPTPPLSPANELGDIESSVSVNASEAMITEAAGRKVSPSEPTHTPPSTPATKQTLAVLGVTLAMLLAPALVESGRPEVARGAAVLGVMALWWVTEVLPLPITSLLPMVLYPLLGVCSASELAKVFFDATSMLFVAGFLVGLAVERWGMHRRIAFSVVALVGGGGMAALIAGFMGSTWLLSMMISNTATTLAMLPVADAFLASLPPGTERFQSGFLLAIGYAATIGGIATPVGTPTNAIFLSQYSLFWPDEPEFSFATFTLAALPLSGCLLVVTWLAICVRFVWRARTPLQVDDLRAFTRSRDALGAWSYEELVLCADLGALILLWFTASWWKPYVAPSLNSGAIGLAMTLPLFLVPCGRSLPASLRRRVGATRCTSAAAAAYDSVPKGLGAAPPPRCILDWDAVKANFKWEILFIFGGGYMVAHGTVRSGLAGVIADCLCSLGLGHAALLFVITLVVCFVTEVVSNMATAAIFGPIVVAAAAKAGFSPVVMLLCVALSSSFAFMLPMAGGPNMTVFSTGRVSIRFMAAQGVGLNLVAVCLGWMYFYYVMPALLGSAYTELSLGFTSTA